jgi:hypothetical protein
MVGLLLFEDAAVDCRSALNSSHSATTSEWVQSTPSAESPTATDANRTDVETHFQREFPFSGRASMVLVAVAVGTTGAAPNPAALSTAWNSASVRSRPPGVLTNISRSRR